ncbi:MAG: DUF4242 domain-containing protein [Ferruginibacter sp.]
MDLHILPGVKARDVAEAHRRDVLMQHAHDCSCITYWIDEKRGNVFCLIEAPCPEAVQELHSKSHGLIPNKVIEVNPALVESFLGRINDPEEVTVNEGLKVFSDPSFRVLLAIKTGDPVLLEHWLGKERSIALLEKLYAAIKQNVAIQQGTAVEYGGALFIASFTVADKAVACIKSIQRSIAEEELEEVGFRAALYAGEPVAESNQLFGDTIQMAERTCIVLKNLHVAVSSVVRDMIPAGYSTRVEAGVMILSSQDEELLKLLFDKLDENWQDTEFSMEDYGLSMAMSQSQLYRKIVALTGFSPNKFLKEFRLEKAKELMKKGSHNISQITFDCGFTSPSYFTKCFKKKYGLLPMEYHGLL